MSKKVIVVCGPTAAGKTVLGVEIALRCGGEVVSADSMQVYRGMDIGTATPTIEERRGVPHHMLDVADPAEPYSVARYVAEAGEVVDKLLERGRLPIVVGGTGLYIDGLIAGREFPAFSGRWRRELQERAAREGIAPLLRELAIVDPERAARLHPADEKRILRALEVWYETGRTITAHDAASAAIPPKYDALYLGLSFRSRADANRRIDRRVEAMLAAGLENEVAALLARGVPRAATSMQAIGYKELLDGLPRDEAAAKIALRSRRYAKRQMTWFGRNPAVRWHLWDGTPNFAAAVQNSTTLVRDFAL